MGLSQRERLQSSAEQVYHVALERLFRPRLMYRLEEVLEANKANPGFIYEALKVYLMVGGVERTDRELVVSWMRNDWADNLYPGAANADGRKALEERTGRDARSRGAATSRWSSPTAPLVEECRRILARLSVARTRLPAAQVAGRQASAAGLGRRPSTAGPDFATVFESAAGDTIESIGVPGFFTYAGFQQAFIDKLPTIADQLQRDNWVLGDAGKLSAITSQFDNLTRDLLNLYAGISSPPGSRRSSKLRMRPLNVGKPKYDALNAAAGIDLADPAVDRIDPG